MFDHPCRDCRVVVSFASKPGDATCPNCGLVMYLTDGDQVGAYPPEDWAPGGIQGRRRLGPGPGDEG